MTLNITGNPAADAELDDNPFSLLTGMLLDQQFPMERAFQGPAVIVERIGGPLDPVAIADHDPEEFAALCSRTPAIHRYPGAMARRIQELARYVVDHYDGATERIWTDPGSAADVRRRLRALPGYGERKVAIFMALLGKQLGVRPDGWEAETGAYGEPGVYRSVADVVDAESLAKVRAYKKETKQANRAASTS